MHDSIGVLGAVSVATACCVNGSIAYEIAGGAEGGQAGSIEHPTGRFTVDIDVTDIDGEHHVRRSALLRTARKLMDGHVYVPEQ